jgi:hypothetical protein
LFVRSVASLPKASEFSTVYLTASQKYAALTGCAALQPLTEGVIWGVTGVAIASSRCSCVMLWCLSMLSMRMSRRCWFAGMLPGSSMRSAVG